MSDRVKRIWVALCGVAGVVMLTKGAEAAAHLWDEIAATLPGDARDLLPAGGTCR